MNSQYLETGAIVPSQNLGNISSSNEPQFIYDTIIFPDALNKDPTIDLIKPLLFINCGGSNFLNIYVDKSMKNQTETIMVNDGADRTMTIRNDSIINDSIINDSAHRTTGTIIWEADQNV
jgi:hypothetical protein